MEPATPEQPTLPHSEGAAHHKGCAGDHGGHGPSSESRVPSGLMAIVDSVFIRAGVRIADWEALTSLFSPRSLEARASVLMAGQSWRRLYYIRQGLIRLFYTDADGNEYNKGFFPEQHCLWPVAPRDRQRGILFDIATIEATEVLDCDMDALQAVLEERGQWRTFALHYAEQLLESKFQREHDLLTLKARDRFEKLQSDMPGLTARIPDYHLASYLGVTNVTLSRLKRDFNKC